MSVAKGEGHIGRWGGPASDTVPDLLLEAAEAYGDRPFLITDRVALSFVEFRRTVCRYANALEAAGVGSGERVGIVMPNDERFPLAWMSLLQLGAIPCSLDARAMGEGLVRQIRIAKVKRVVADPSFLEAVESVATPLAVSRQEEGALAGRHYGGTLRARSALRLDRYIDEAQSDRPMPAISGGSPSGILFSSGTTGGSKGIVGYHSAYAKQALDCAVFMGLSTSDRLMCCLPWHHGNPQLLTFLPALLAGSSYYLHSGFSASNFWADARQHDVTGFGYVGTMLRILLKHETEPSDPEEGRVSFCYGGGATWEERQAFRRRFGVEVVEAYGLTEFGGIIASNTRGSSARGCGRVRERVTLAIVDSADRPLPAGSSGEIVLRPTEPFVHSAGYFDEPGITLETYRNLWFHTGDLAELDSTGILHFIGRRSENIRRRGENIAASEIEEAILQMSSVLECAVVGVPDDISEEEIKACVVIAERGPSPEEIWHHCGSVLPRHMVPRFIEIVPGLAKTPTEKVKRRELAEAGVVRAWDSAATPR